MPILERSRMEAFVMSCPLNRISPLSILPVFPKRAIIAEIATDFPDPLSPTSPMMSPGCTEKENPFSTRTVSFAV